MFLVKFRHTLTKLNIDIHKSYELLGLSYKTKQNYDSHHVLWGPFTTKKKMINDVT